MKPKTAATVCGLAAGPSIAMVANTASYKLALAAVVGMFASLLVVMVPNLGFWLTALMIPLERFGRFTDDSSLFTISLMRLVGVLTVLGVALQLLVTRQRPRFGHLFWLYAAYVMWALASSLHSSDFEESLRAGGQLVGNLLFFYVVIALARNFRLVQQGTYLWLIATGLIGAYTVYDWHFGGDFTMGSPDEGLSTGDRWRAVGLDSNEWESLDIIPRAIGSTTHSAVYGINLINAIPFLILFWRDAKSSRMRAIWFLLLAVTSYNVVLTNTRSVLLTFVLTLGLCWWRRLLVVRWQWFAVGGLFLVTLLPWMELSRFQRIFDPSNYTVERSATLRHRLTYWSAGLQVIRDNWLLGVGMGNENEIPKYLKEDYTAQRTSVHNEYLQTMMELGIIGFGLFFSFVALILRDCKAAIRTFREHAAEPQHGFAVACWVAMVITLLYGIQVDVFRFPLKGWWYVAAVTVLLRQLARCLEQKRVTVDQLGECDAWAV